MYSDRVRDGLGNGVSKNDNRSKRGEESYTVIAPKIRAY
jgi:hypothetical protein